MGPVAPKRTYNGVLISPTSFCLTASDGAAGEFLQSLWCKSICRGAERKSAWNNCRVEERRHLLVENREGRTQCYTAVPISSKGVMARRSFPRQFAGSAARCCSFILWAGFIAQAAQHHDEERLEFR